jgi:hypothetical protein
VTRRRRDNREVHPVAETLDLSDSDFHVGGVRLRTQPGVYSRGRAAYVKRLNADHARKKRAESRQEAALREAIELVHGTGPCGNPWKEAVTIISAVNERLESMKLA